MKHGTRSGYAQHLLSGEPACDACRLANNRHSRDHWRRHHPLPYTLTRHLTDVIDAHGPVTMTELPSLIPDAKPDTLRRTAHRLLDRGVLVRVGTDPLTIGRTT